MPSGLRVAGSALDALERLAAADLPAQELLEEAARRIDRVVPSDGFFHGATDPHTTFCLGPGVVHDLPEDQCTPTWEYEFLVPDDVLKFRDIARGPSPVACLHEATGGHPGRSARWRAFSSATGFRSEVRMTFPSTGGVYGVAQIDRLGDAPRFTEEERAWLARAAPVIGRGLRRALRTDRAGAVAGRGPGMLVLDAAGSILSATAEAHAWLNELDGWTGAPASDGSQLPLAAHVSAAAVRSAVARPGPTTGPVARLRTRHGVWLVVHASMLQDSEKLAVMIEPAKAGDVAPLIVEAYALTPRELDVTRAIARGLGTTEIAAHLHLSPHTVRDHVKAIFEKTGVSSRGELVAKVFAEHYSPVHVHI